MSASILYIHGFNSAPASNKASQLITVMDSLGLADQLRVPALHHHPARRSPSWRRLSVTSEGHCW